MNFKNFQVGSDDCGRRLDRIVRKFLPNLKISFVYKNIRTGFIRVNNQKQKQEYRIQASDVLNIAEILLTDEKKQISKNQNKQIVSSSKNNHFANFPSLQILLKNENFLIINKPYNIPVQGNSNTDVSLDNIVRETYKATTTSLTFSPGPLHRLDRRTTGVLVFSQSLKGAQWFSNAIQEKRIQKEYLGLICGHLEKTCRWKDFIDDTYKNNSGFRTVKTFSTLEEEKSLETDLDTDQKQTEPSPVLKEAITNVEPIAYAVINALGKKIPVTLAHYVIETGRMHQIRAQSAFHGYPLAGDSAYSNGEYDYVRLKSFGIHFPENKDPIPEFLLHAIRLEIPEDNNLGLPKEIIAPLPTFFSKIITTYFASCNFRLII